MTASTTATHAHDPSAAAPDYVRSIAPYLPGKPVSELAREFGLAEADIVKLASNENPRGPSPAVRAAIAAATDSLSRYPDGNGFALKAALAQRLGVGAESIVLGNGSNDILELVTQAFLKPGDAAVYSRHAFAVYPLATQARGAHGIEVAAHDFGHDLAAMRRAITARTRIVFVANPNNPTGTWIAPDALESFIASVPRVTQSSICAIWRLTADCDSASSSAARVKLSRRAAASKLRSSSSRGRSERRCTGAVVGFCGFAFCERCLLYTSPSPRD